MTSAQQRALLAGANCEIAFDDFTRQLYSTDASIYRIEPAAVAFPKGARQAATLIQAAMQAGVCIIPRGAGTGLAGGAIGEGLVLDFSRYNRDITELDLDRNTVRVSPGVVLDQLNSFLRPHGYCFGPDVATSSRATLGGMIANNSSGAHTPAYGTTVQHVNELEVVLADGQVVRVGPGYDTLRKQRELMHDVAELHLMEIQQRMPPGLLKRWHGYGLERCVQEPDNLLHLLCGSEGTLAGITSAELKIVPVPEQKGLALLFFAGISDAMQATVELMDLHPAAIEHMDRVLLDQTKGQREFQAARDLLDLDHRPCQSVLVVEFFDDLEDRLSAVTKRNLGLRTQILKSSAESNLVWALRKAGLSLLTGRKGRAKPLTGIEDTAVRPAQLPEYVRAIQGLMGRQGLEASYYGHAAAGLLHVRPILDTRSLEDLKKFRQLAHEVSALLKQFKGSLAAEHGVGIARTEFMEEQLGEHLLQVMREIKESFDPHNLLNPGKLVPDGRFEIDSNLRNPPGLEIELPFKPMLAFAAKDGSFAANLDQCNGCGGCRKETPSMCPTFMVTGEEVMSTRGRANIIRAFLDHAKPELNGNALNWSDLDRALAGCLSCKACTSECPSNVNMSLLKAELLHGRIEQQGLTFKQRLFSSVDRLGRIGCAVPWLANPVLENWVFRRVLLGLLGLAWKRKLPRYARQRFDDWFRNRDRTTRLIRGRVILWDDTFVRYHEPHIGIAAVKVLEAAKFQVDLVSQRECCGRPAFSQGHLDRARQLGRHNVALLNSTPDNAPILFLEPSCYSMFVEDYEELKLQGAERVARRCFLFEEFIEQLLTHEPGALKFKPKDSTILIHPHCHVKSLTNPDFLARLASRLPEREVTLLNTACCGMAGGFGMIESNYELSLKVGEPLAQQVRGQTPGTVVVASGTSCRQQISHLAGIRPRHMAELLADALSAAAE